MIFLTTLLAPLQFLNDHVLRIGRSIAVLAMALMVVVILVQVFCRYVLNNALPWPDEAARFLMLWMTGLIAGSAYRRGGFVAIDMLENALPRRISAILSLFLLVVSLCVLIVAIQLGWNHVNSGWLFASSSLKIPLAIIGLKTIKIKLAWMYMSMFVGVVILTAVNIELILRSLITLGGKGDDLRPIPLAEADVGGPE
jgi:TRAP-type C4-dicarboxylate transport system permease small subunit